MRVPSLPIQQLNERELLIVTLTTVQAIDQRMKTLEAADAASASRIAELERITTSQARDISELRGQVARDELESGEHSGAALTKATQALELVEDLRDELLVDSGKGKRVPLREMFVEQQQKTRALQAQIAAGLGALAVVWPFVAEYIKRLVWP